MGTLFLHTKLAPVRWRTRSLLGRRLLGTFRVVFSCIGTEIDGRSCVHALIVLANAIPTLANAPSAMLPWA